MYSLLKLAVFIGAVVLAVIVFIHILPFVIAILALCAVVKLWHWLNRPRDNRPLPRWPWRDP